VCEELKKDTKSYWKKLHHEGIRNNDQLSLVCNPDETGMPHRFATHGIFFLRRMKVFSGLGEIL